MRYPKCPDQNIVEVMHHTARCDAQVFHDLILQELMYESVFLVKKLCQEVLSVSNSWMPRYEGFWPRPIALMMVSIGALIALRTKRKISTSC